MGTKCSLLKRSCKKRCLRRQVQMIIHSCHTWGQVLQRLEKTYPVDETDLSVRTEIEGLPMLPALKSNLFFTNLDISMSLVVAW